MISYGQNAGDCDYAYNKLVDCWEQQILHITAASEADQVDHARHGVQRGGLNDDRGDGRVHLPVLRTDPARRECATHHDEPEGDRETQEDVETNGEGPEGCGELDGNVRPQASAWLSLLEDGKAVQSCARTLEYMTSWNTNKKSSGAYLLQ